MSTELVERLRAGPIRTGDSENGEYELFDIEEAAQTMGEAADELTALTAKVALLTEALKFYRDEFHPKIGKPVPGASSITFHPSEALLEDCGNRAMAALSEPDKNET